MRAAILLLAAAAVLPAASKPEFRAGVAAVKITPDKPIWMSGYGHRTRPSEGTLQDLWAKALAIEDRRGHRVVIVTTDLLGLTRDVTDHVSAQALKQWDLQRPQILFNSSHTHTGPLIRVQQTMFELSPDNAKVIDEYRTRLNEQLLTVIGSALGNLEPATLRYAEGETGFAVNRRQFTPDGVKLGVQPDGPKDHRVPVFEIRGAKGVKAVLFGYACHNTTLGHYKVSGDYAGFAQSEIEQRMPGTTALFVLLCGGDQNPNPRGTDELAMQHGRSLAGSVAKALDGPGEPVSGRIRSAFQFVDLAFRVHTREDFEKELKHTSAFNRRRAQLNLSKYDAGHPVRTLAYPVQAIRFDRGPALLALGGEVVIDYSNRARKEFPKEKLVVAGYSNDVMCYIPSKRVLKEGGYEADFSMIYYGQPGPFAEDVEERVFTGIRSVMKRVGAK
ncbi:MAG: hypothetical protein FJW39_24730 [Acidobacteria bacterium]|nr:hypothetical protein [Acidobacteriota bacterium]